MDRMALDEIQQDLYKKHLNLEKIFGLSKRDKKVVIKLYNDLMDAFNSKENMLGGMPSMDFSRIYTLYNTLTENDYLVTKREANLDKVLS